MRGIKFRAWFEVHNKMIESTNLLFEYNGPDDGFITACDNESTDSTFNAILMQYTGLTDKNGREIYEGDIIAYIDSVDASTESGYNFYEFMNKGQIIFNEKYGRFDVTDRSDIDYFDFVECTSEYEIIGNIYEHPHLLEAK